MPLVAGLASAITGLAVTFRPDLMANGRLPTGGDMGAHHYIAKSLATEFPRRLWIWGSGWYAGMPLLHFYFPLPYAAMLALSPVLGYPVAFKIIATAGVASIPFSMASCLRLLGADKYTTAFGLAFSLVFLYNDSYTILGGNIDSTMAGEFAYAISLSLVLLLIGITYRRLVIEERRDIATLVLPSLLLGAIFLSHVLPVPAAVVAFAVMIPGRRWLPRLWRLALIGLLGLGVAAALLIPLLARMDYTAHPKWNPVRGWAIFVGGPACSGTCRWSTAPAAMVILAATGVALAVITRRRWTLVPTAIALTGAAGTLLWPAGAVWNLRWLPLFYVGCAMLASFACGEVMKAIASRSETETVARGSASIAIAAIATFAMLTSQYAPSWVIYNYSGYQAKPGWEEYQDLMTTLGDLDDARIMWEYSDKYQEFGTTRALELIPYWTDRRSMEGLLIESSITAPGHFIMQSETSMKSTGAVPGVPYPGFDFEAGLEHMKIYGIGYFVAFTDEVKAAARTNGLPEVAKSGRFTIFEVDSGGEVEVPRYRPLLGDRDAWRDQSLEWLENPSAPVVFPQSEVGPSAKQLNPAVRPEFELLPAAEDAHVRVDRPKDGVIEFRTNKVGEPHIVKESWFPTWSVEGAEGPYLVTPSLMLVFPTQEDVRLVEKARSLDRLAQVVSLLALAAIGLMGLLGRRKLGMLAAQPQSEG
ncbi:MAG: hypothetical protein DCC49_06140 [Acidobacteria bacterium]|nr:MAG: hypothetical protein DCC49_06140 [Acidobacteriota bacterium]